MLVKGHKPDIAPDMLVIFINRAKEDGQVDGLIPHLVDGGESILQYADDTFIFMEHDLENVLNIKLILCIFEQLSRLKINFHKSEIFFFVLVRPPRWWTNTNFSLDVGMVLFHFNI
jgi:hypothetical protein